MMLLHQNVMVIDQPDQIEKLIRAGVFSCALALDFCENNRTQAVKKIEIFRPDLIISTLGYSDGTAIDFIHDLEQRGRKIPAMFLADPELENVKTEILKKGNFEVINRSEEVTELLKRVDHSIRLQQHIRQPSRLESFVSHATPDQLLDNPINKK